MDVAEFHRHARLTVEEAAERSGMPFRELKRRIADGKGPQIEEFRAVRWIRLDHLNAWLAHIGRKLAA